MEITTIPQKKPDFSIVLNYEEMRTLAAALNDARARLVDCGEADARYVVVSDMIEMALMDTQ